MLKLLAITLSHSSTMLSDAVLPEVLERLLPLLARADLTGALHADVAATAARILALLHATATWWLAITLRVCAAADPAAAWSSCRAHHDTAEHCDGGVRGWPLIGWPGATQCRAPRNA